MSETEVLIVGAGPTGLMLACLLRRWNIECRIIDKGTSQAHESRALVVQARSLEIFQMMGLEQDFLSNGITDQGAYLIRPDGYIAFRMDHLDFAELKDLWQKFFKI
jgi:2-polyprenyl-6-methoxyphenol hydroxylase-like FAD-dependent oxidoreductase